MTILLAEDNPALRNLIAEWLRHSGYTVLIAPDGQVAMELAKGHSGEIEAIVTDFSMPGVSGIELVRQIRLTRPNIGAVLLTGYWIHPRPEDVAIEYLNKPCSASTLIAAIKRAA